MKKRFAFILALVCVLTLAGAAFADHKIAIITGPVGSDAESFLAAQRLQTAYPDVIATDTYPDDAQTDPQLLAQRITDFALDPDVRAIIVCHAAEGTAEAFETVRGEREDILLLAAGTQSQALLAAPAADAALCVDVGGEGAQIVGIAKGWDAEVLVHYTFPSHMEQAEIAGRHEAMAAAATEAGIEFVSRDAPDLPEDSALQAAYEDDVAAVMQTYAGRKVAFFTTDGEHEEALERAVVGQPDACYPQPSNPSPYGGIAAALDLAESDIAQADTSVMLQEIAAALSQKDALGRVSTWAMSAEAAMMETLYDYASRYAQGGFAERNNAEEMLASLRAVAGDGAGYTHAVDARENIYAILLPGVDYTQITQ